MPDIKISELSTLQTLGNTDVIPLTSNGVSAKVEAQKVKEYAVGTVDISGIGNGTVTGAITTINTLLQGVLGNFATIESSTTSTHEYSAGKYLLLNGVLYRVTAEIEVADTIAVGTNVVRTTVEEEYRNLTIWKSAQSIASTSGSSGTLCTITDPAITADHVLDKFVAADRSVITSDISCTCSTGQAVITGISTAATSAEIKLVKVTKVLS